MKKINIILGVMALTAVMFSCAKEVPQNPNEDVNVEESVDENESEGSNPAGLYGFAAHGEALTKVSISEDGATEWEDGDVALVYDPATGNSAEFVYSVESEMFESEQPVKGEALQFYYPAEYFSVGDDAVALAVPLSVTAEDAEYYGYKSPMKGTLKSGRLADKTAFVEFFNEGAILRVNLTGMGLKGETVTSVVLSNGETSVTVDCADHDIALTSEKAASVHFYMPAEVESALAVKVNYAKADWESAPYTQISRKDVLTPERSCLYELNMTAGHFSGGDGTAENPYLIATADDFKAISAAVASTDAEWGYNETAAGTFFGSAGVHYQQTADINFGEGGEKGDLSSSMIGSSAHAFKGSYNGKSGENQYSISNFSISAADVQYVGLFAYCSGATISNIKIVGASVVGKTHVGIVIGRTDASSISGCEVAADCSVEGKEGAVAGIAGSAYTETAITNCINRASSTNGEGTGTNIAGIVGYTASAALQNVQNYGTVTGDNQVGGITGRLANGTISDSHNKGTLSGVAYVGGITGVQNAGVIQACTSKAGITSTEDYAAGIVGYMHQGVVNNCYTKGNISGRAYVAGLVGYAYSDQGRVAVLNSLANASVTASQGENSHSGGVIGRISGSGDGTDNRYLITVTNCVGMDVAVHETNTEDCTRFGAFTGFINSANNNDSAIKKVRVYNNYTMVSDENFSVACATASNYGGFVGYFQRGQIGECYYLNSATNVKVDSNDNYVNVTKLASENINGNTEVSLTCRKGDYTGDFCGLLDTGKFGNQTVEDVEYTISDWTTSVTSYPLPSSLVALGEEYYK